MPMTKKPGLILPSTGYKPFRYPWAYNLWKRQQMVHWLPTEVPLGEDMKDWADQLDDGERELLTQVFRFFTQADVDVADNYMERYSRFFKPVEVKMMLSAFAAMEAVHIDAYSLLIETVGMPESEYSAFMQQEEMRAKHDFSRSFGESDVFMHPLEMCVTLAAFGGFIEGLQLFSSFAILANFPRRGLMKGMGQIVSWSVRDETLHCEGICRLFRTLLDEITDNRRDEQTVVEVGLGVRDAAFRSIELEDAFVDAAFGAADWDIEGLEAEDVKEYVRWVAAQRFQQLFLPVPQELDEYVGIQHPLPWLPEVLEAVEHANFFETRATEYTKASSQGNWNDAWNVFDKGFGR